MPRGPEGGSCLPPTLTFWPRPCYHTPHPSLLLPVAHRKWGTGRFCVVVWCICVLLITYCKKLLVNSVKVNNQISCMAALHSSTWWTLTVADHSIAVCCMNVELETASVLVKGGVLGGSTAPGCWVVAFSRWRMCLWFPCITRAVTSRSTCCCHGGYIMTPVSHC